jgi:hypothetical protein
LLQQLLLQFHLAEHYAVTTSRSQTNRVNELVLLVLPV